MLVKFWRNCWRFAIFRALYRLVEFEVDFERKKVVLAPKRDKYGSPF